MKIYKITNLINNKVYIGLTTQSLTGRQKQHKYDSNRLDNKLYRAVKKYGWENFSFSIVEDGIKTIEELQEKEMYYISLYDSYNKGYNSSLGGEGVKTIQLDEQEVINSYLNTKSSIKTADIFKISENSVLRILHKNNIKLFGSGNNHIKNEITYEKVIKTYLKEKSIKKTALILNIAESSVSRILEENSVEKFYYSFSEKEELEIVNLYKSSSKSLTQLEKDLGISRKVLSRILKKHGVVVQNNRNKTSKITMYYNETEIHFNSIAECINYIVENQLTKSSNVKTIRNGIENSIKNKKPYYGLTFIKE